MTDHHGKVGFAVGTGRCGTSFLARLLALEPGVSTADERNPLNEAFHRYCKWYGLPVDHEGFLWTKETEIQKDLQNQQFSFESSSFLSLSISELYDRFDAKFILIVRRPDFVVTSCFRKGWFQEPVKRINPELALGYQKSEQFHHFLGRIVPSGDKFFEWQKMTRIGKLAWYWSALNTAVIEQFSKIPETHWRIQKLEQLTYQCYLEIAGVLGLESKVTQDEYQKVVQRLPDLMRDVPIYADWSDQEIMEFESGVKVLSKELGYEYRIHKLKVPKLAVRLPSNPGRKILSGFFHVLGGLSARIQRWSSKRIEKLNR